MREKGVAKTGLDVPRGADVRPRSATGEGEGEEKSSRNPHPSRDIAAARVTALPPGGTESVDQVRPSRTVTGAGPPNRAAASQTTSKTSPRY